MRRRQCRPTAVFGKMIIFLPLLYTVLATGGYLDKIDFEAIKNFGTGLLDDNSSDTATSLPSLNLYGSKNATDVLRKTFSGGYLDYIDFESLKNFGMEFILKQFNYTKIESDSQNPYDSKNQPPDLHKTGEKRLIGLRQFNTDPLSNKRLKRTRPPFKNKYFFKKNYKRNSIKQNKSRRKHQKTRETTTQATTKASTMSRKHMKTTNYSLQDDNDTDDAILETVELEFELMDSVVTTEGRQLESATILTTTDIPLQSHYVTKYIEICPEEGFFFKKDLQGSTAGTCYLCFCKENGTSVCWLRDNKKCDAESYQHNLKKRSRRSPISFSNLFIGDATRDVLNSNGKKQCKPHEASYSEGCPPVDWCVGCTVCDCNINGRWDCHLLSFCTEEDKKKTKKKDKEIAQPYDPFTTPKTRRAERQRAREAVEKLAEKMAQARQKKKIGKSNSRRYFFKNGTLVNKTIFDLRKIKKSPTILNQTSEEIQKWTDLNMKIRKIPDALQRQMLIDKQQNNAKKVSESANFLVRKMPRGKARRNMEKKQAAAVTMLSQRKPSRKKKRQVVLPPGIKLPKELLDKLPPGIIPPTRNPPESHFPKKSHIKRVLQNQMTATKPSRQKIREKKQFKRSLDESPKDRVLVKRNTKDEKALRKVSKTKKRQSNAKHQAKKNTSTIKMNIRKGYRAIPVKLMGLKEKAKYREKKKILNRNKPVIQNITNRTKSQKVINAKKNKDINKDLSKQKKAKDKNKDNNNNVKGIVRKKNDNHAKSENNNKKIQLNDKNTKKIQKGNDERNNKKQKNKLTNNNNIIRASNINKHMMAKNGTAKKSLIHNYKKNNNKNKNNKKKLNSLKDNKIKNDLQIISQDNLNNVSLKVNKKTSNTENNVKSKRKANEEISYKIVTEGKKVIKTASPKANTVRVKKATQLIIDEKKLNQEVKKLTENIQGNLNSRIVDAVGQALGIPIQKSKKAKRSTRFENKMQGNLADEVYYPYDDQSSLLKSSVDKSYKLKKHRIKRDVIDKQSATMKLTDFGNEISTNYIQDISTLEEQNKLDTTDSTFQYYKYKIDNFENTQPKNNSYLAEIVEDFTKNNAAKRSVDNQMQGSISGMHVLQKSPSESNNETVLVNGWDKNLYNFTSAHLPRLQTSDNNELRGHPAKLSSLKPINVLDDKVVIIQDKNLTTLEYSREFISNPTETPSFMNVEFSLNNKTEIHTQGSKTTTESIKMDELFSTVSSKIINNDPTTVVDKTVVIINDSTTKLPDAESVLKLTSENNDQSNLVSTFPTKHSKDSSLTTEQNNLLSIPVSGTTVGTQKSSNNTIKPVKNALLTNAPFINQIDTFKSTRENKSMQIPSVPIDISYSYGAKNNTILSNNVDENTVTSVEKTETNVDMSRANSITDKITAGSMENELKKFKLTNKNYVKYELEPKTYNIKQNISNLLRLSKHNKKNKQRIEGNAIVNDTHNSSTNNFKHKHRLDDYVVIVLQKDAFPKIKEIITEVNNITLLKNNTYQGKTDSTAKWVENITRNAMERNITTQFTGNVSKISDNILNDTEMHLHKHQVKSNEIKKITCNRTGKRKLKKILTTPYNKSNKEERYLITPNENIWKIENKKNYLKNFFKKLLDQFKFNKHTRKPSKIKRYKILKYLKKFFTAIFSSNGRHLKNKTITQLNRKHVLDTLCATFGPCNINVKNKAKLRAQINHLNSETYKMLRSVKIIKGLLKLVDSAKCGKELSNAKDTKSHFKSDVQKLHSILKDTYLHKENQDGLTETQKVQIQYIKNNTQNFIQSVAKFTFVLNDIINTITVPEHIAKSKENLHQSKNEKKEEAHTKTILVKQLKNKTVPVTESNEQLQQLKVLITKYRLIQNTFMRKIHNIITNLDSKQNNLQTELISSTQTPKIQNKTQEIKAYSKNIIQNLKKLKNLAQTLNGNARRKRDLGDDHSIEYLLMLMEYMLNKNHPLDAAPVNDGIDLLIEAIQNAPDIKTIKKKVLPNDKHPKNLILQQSNKPDKFTMKALIKPTVISADLDSSNDNNSLESNSKASKEENVTSIILEDEPKLNVIGQPGNDEVDEEEYYTFDKRSQLPSKEEKNAEFSDNLTTTGKYTTIEQFSTTSVPSHNNHHHKKSDVVRATKPKLTVASSIKENNARRKTIDFFEVHPTNTVPEYEFTDSNVETRTQETTTPTEPTTETIIGHPVKNSYSQIKNIFKDDDDVSAGKSRIDWLDETYEEEIKSAFERSDTTTKKHTETTKFSESTTETTINTAKHRRLFNVSENSNEDYDESRKKVTKEILRKKEMNLLSSLDYGNEKLADLDSGSKESNSDDKYSGAAFSTYFNEERI